MGNDFHTNNYNFILQLTTSSDLLGPKTRTAKILPVQVSAHAGQRERCAIAWLRIGTGCPIIILIDLIIRRQQSVWLDVVVNCANSVATE